MSLATRYGPATAGSAAPVRWLDTTTLVALAPLLYALNPVTYILAPSADSPANYVPSAALLALAVVIALIRWVRGDLSRPPTRLDLPILVFALLCCLAAAIGVVRRNPTTFVLGDLYQSLEFPVYYFVLTLLVQERSQLARALVVLAVLICLTVVEDGFALLLGRSSQLAVGSQLGLPRIINTPATLMIPALVAALALGERAWRGRLIIALGLGVVSTLLSLTRGLWAASIASLAFLLLGFTWQRRTQLFGLGLVGVLGAVALAQLIHTLDPKLPDVTALLVDRVEYTSVQLFHPVNAVQERRTIEIETVLRLLPQSPFFGFGLGATYLGATGNSLSSLSFGERHYLHDQYAGILYRMGLVGMAGYAWLTVSFLNRTVGAYLRSGAAGSKLLIGGLTASFVGLATLSFTSDALLRHPTSLMVALAMAGAVVAARQAAPAAGPGPAAVPGGRLIEGWAKRLVTRQSYYAALFRRRLWLLIGLPALATVASAVFGAVTPPVYQAQVTVLVRPAQPLGGSAAASPTAVDEILGTYARLATERPLLDQVNRELNLHTGADDLSRRIEVKPLYGTSILEIDVRDGDPARARDIANRLVADLIAQTERIQRQDQASGSGVPPDNLVVVAPAGLPSSPVWPLRLLLAAGALTIGLVLTVGIVVLMELFRDTVKTDDDLVSGPGLLPLAHVDVLPSSSPWRPASVAAADGPDAEAYRELRINLLFSTLDRPARRIAVISPARGEGRSRAAANLAVALARAGSDTVLVDADLRGPSQHGLFGAPGQVGVSSVVAGKSPLRSALQPVDGIPHLWLLPAGHAPDQPSELLSSRAMPALMSELSHRFAFVVVDTAALLAVSDAAVVASYVDAALVVVEHGRTSASDLTSVRRTLERVGCPVLGAVVNKVRVRRPPGRSHTAVARDQA